MSSQQSPSSLRLLKRAAASLSCEEDSDKVFFIWKFPPEVAGLLKEAGPERLLYAILYAKQKNMQFGALAFPQCDWLLQTSLKIWTNLIGYFVLVFVFLLAGKMMQFRAKTLKLNSH